MGLFNLFSKKQQQANQSFLAKQRSQQAIVKIKKLALPSRIKRQLIKAEVYDIWLNSHDLLPLANLIEESETIEYAAVGIDEHSKTVMLICTNYRLLILQKKMTSENTNIIPLAQIKSVILKQQLAYAELKLIVGDAQLDFNSLNKVPAGILADKIRKYAKLAQKGSAIDQQLEQIKKLKGLKDEGILTEEEFQSKKKKILDM